MSDAGAVVLGRVMAPTRIPDFGPIALWRCPAPAPARLQHYPPILVYLLGDDGPVLGKGLFEFVQDDDIGDVVSHQGSFH